MTTQRLTLTLEGITAGDYLTWLRDPEPPALGRDLHAIEVRAEPLGDTVDAVLTWNGAAPAARDAGPLAGLPLTPEVAALAAPLEDATSSRESGIAGDADRGMFARHRRPNSDHLAKRHDGGPLRARVLVG